MFNQELMLCPSGPPILIFRGINCLPLTTYPFKVFCCIFAEKSLTRHRTHVHTKHSIKQSLGVLWYIKTNFIRLSIESFELLSNFTKLLDFIGITQFRVGDRSPIKHLFWWPAVAQALEVNM